MNPGSRDPGHLPGVGDRRTDLLQVEGQVWRDGRLGSQTASGAGGGEQPAQAIAG